MKINTIFPDEKNFSRVLERFHRVADERGFTHEEALIAAMQLWIGEDLTTWVTPAEWKELVPELERIRARTRPVETV